MSETKKQELPKTKTEWLAAWRRANLKIVAEQNRTPSDPALVAEHRLSRDFAYLQWKQARND